jgi:hypothetical protein
MLPDLLPMVDQRRPHGPIRDASAGTLLLSIAVLLAGTFRLSPAWAQEPTDKYGGLERITGNRGPTYHVEKIGKRWWLVSPEGHGLFVRAVSKVDTADWGGSGGFLAYDGVYLQSTGGTLSANLSKAAESTIPKDVVQPATGVTLRAKGDALYVGSSRFKPNYTYFWLDRLGQGGRLEWYYSTNNGWRLIREMGKPVQGVVLSPNGGWNLDVGNYMAPDENGFGQWENRQANKITWWDMKEGFPPDFVPTSLPGDPAPRYYLKAVVAQDFTTAPVLNQCYERAELGEAIAKKYSPGDYFGQWAQAMTQRLTSWGFNVVGLYSPRYTASVGSPAQRLPVEPTWALGGWATRKDYPYHVKNVYAGAVFPPGSKNLLWQGLQPDVFEPGFEKAYRELVAKQGAVQDVWSWALVPEEADYLFGLDSLTHDHMGYVILAQNPCQPRAQRDGQEITYGDRRLYAKYALRDFLRDRYRPADDKAPAFSGESATPLYVYARQPAGLEAAALENLDRAWGTHYTTWDTSAGDLLQSNNAYGSGTGFMDENGRGVVAPNVRSVGFDQQFTNPAYPAIRKDLDDFIGVFAAHYGVVLDRVFKTIPHPMLLLPIYNGPDCVYRSLAPYVDAFWVSVPKVEDALRIYKAGRKPLVVGDYLSADPDSPLYFKARIAALRYGAAAGNTILDAPDLRYVFRGAQTIAFPDCTELAEKGTCGGKYLYPYPRVKAARWNVLEVPGDFTLGLRPGMHVEMSKYGKYPYPRRTQEDRARAMIQLYQSLLNLQGDDGIYFILGTEHWCLYDPAVSNWADNENFGLATLQDNAYDGREARQAAGLDPRGYPIGGEEADYGNLLGPLSGFLRDLDRQIRTD